MSAATDAAGSASPPSSPPADEVAGGGGRSGALPEELARNGSLEKEGGDGLSKGEGADLGGEGVESRGRGREGVWEGAIGQGRRFRSVKPVNYSESEEEERSVRRRRKRKKNRCKKVAGKGEVDGRERETKKKRRSSVGRGSDGAGFSGEGLNGQEHKVAGPKDERLRVEEDASSKERRTTAGETEVKMISFCLFCSVMFCYS